MNSGGHYFHEKKRTGAVRASDFIKEKREIVGKCEKALQRFGDTGVIRAAGEALRAVHSLKTYPADDGGGVYIYGVALGYISSCGGNVGFGSLYCYLSDCGEKLGCAELYHLPDFLRIAVCERIYELSESDKNDDEIIRLLSADVKLSRIDFGALFSSFCEAEKIFGADPVFRICSEKTKHMYMAGLEKYSKSLGIGEEEAAQRILLESKKRGTGIYELLTEKKKSTEKAYFISLAVLIAVFAVLFCVLVGFKWYFLLILPFLLVALYDFVKKLLSGIFLRIGGGELPAVSGGEELENARCLVIIAALIYGDDRDAGIFDRLEDFYLRNRDKNFTFAVLGDLGEADSAEIEKDTKTVSYAKSRILALNQKYGGSFALFIRRREYCGCQKKYLGKERKRGGILELCRFLRSENTDYTCFIGDKEKLRSCSHLLTLDADTDLFFGSVRKLLGVMLHPYNKPVIDAERGRVIRGHAILQPTVICSLSAANKTAFSRLTEGEGGVDVYSGTGRDLWQSISGAGNFCGKGMIDIDAYLSVCGRIFPNERVLSHDLPEGILLRSAVATDIVMTDGTPRNAISYYKRLHRWIRGDLQSLIFLRKSFINSEGVSVKNPFTTEGKYKIIDNVLYHSAPLCSIIAFLLSLVFGGKIASVTALFAFSNIIYPFVLSVVRPVISGDIFIRGNFYSAVSGMKSGLFRFIYTVSALAHEAYVFADAAVRTSWRFAVSGEHFLDWLTAAQGDAEKSGGILCYYKSMWVSAATGILMLFIPSALAKIFGFLWFVFPAFMYLCSAQSDENKKISRRNVAVLKNNARKIWRYFTDFVTEKTNWLPPDNYQLSPVERTAMRTSPTNIGMYLLSALSARDFGLIDSAVLEKYMRKSSDTLTKMLRWHGHFYNWYDVRTLSVIGEPFVSSVDSGNLTVSLVALCEGLKEYAGEAVGLLDSVAIFEKLIAETDFSALYDYGQKLFYVGYNVRNSTFSSSFYDIFMSEARLTGYFAVSSGQVPPEHYYAPARKAGVSGGKTGEKSWSGTAFEFFMPALFLPLEKNSVTDRALEYAFDIQKKSSVSRFNGKQIKTVFGVSESQYFGFDYEMNYQYKAFGVRDLSLDPSAKTDEVISPYSSFLMLGTARGAALANLRALSSFGMLGKYGYYEALDLYRGRVGNGYAVIKSYMSHHLGMSMVAAANACMGGVFVKRFLKNPQMRAGRLLLEERLIKRTDAEKPSIKKETPPARPSAVPQTYSETPYEYSVIYPDAAMLSNNKTRLVASTSGHVELSDGDECVCYSDFDRFGVLHGFSVVAEADGVLISAFPLGYTDSDLKSRFDFKSDDEKITYISHHEKRGFSVDFTVTLSVSPENSVLNISAGLSGNFKNSRIMLYFEPVMQSEKAYTAHKSFSGLSVESEYNEREKTIIFHRRPRSEGSGSYLCLTEKSGAEFEFDTGKDSLLPGFGTREIANLISVPCKSSVGAPITPACRIVCPKARRASFAVGTGKNVEDILFYLKKAPRSGEYSRLSALWHSSAGIGKNAAALERFLLRGIYFPVPEPHTADAVSIGLLKKHPFEKSRLYKYSISGENPMIGVRFFRTGGKQTENLRTLLSLFKYSCVRGLRFDFIILYSENDFYRAPVLAHLKKLISESGCENFYGAPRGIFTINVSELEGGEEYAITRLCGAVIDASVPLSVTVRTNKFFIPVSSETEKMLVSPANYSVHPCAKPEIQNSVRVFGGEFHNDGFLADKKQISKPWSDVISSYALGFVATQNSAGFTFGTNSALCKLTPHTADALSEDGGEALYLRVYSAADGSYADYNLCAGASYVDFRFGCAVYYGRAAGIGYKITLSADKKLAVKYFDISADTFGSEVRLAVICRIIPVIGQNPANSRAYIYEKDAERCSVKVYRLVSGDYNRGIALMCDCDGEIFTDRTALISDGKIYCGMSDCAAIKPEIETDGRFSCSFALAAFHGDEDYKYICSSFKNGKRSLSFDNPAPEVSIKSGDSVFDLTVNRWFLYQCRVGRTVARCGFYQVGGAYGFRDQLQDSISLGEEAMRRQILYCASHQYREGDVMHWWHNLGSASGHRGIRSRCSDDVAWLIYACCLYIGMYGDSGICDVKLPFLLSPPLNKNETERYEFAPFSREKEPLYSHLLLAAERLCKVGSHGLSLIGSHDWNDGMNNVGVRGRGESVWLSQFAAMTLRMFSEVCKSRGDNESGERYRRVSENLLTAVNNVAFEGDRYIRGFYDNGQPLGSKQSGDCKIDAITQAFSAFTIKNGEDYRRSKTALLTLKNELTDEKHGLVRLLAPPFDSPAQSPGYIKSYVPGVRENGGQYTHAAIWAAMAYFFTGEGEYGTKLLKMINPAIRAKNRADAERYGAEPYVLCGDVYSVGKNAGRGGWSWYTGASGWYRNAVIYCICGYRRHGGGFSLEPSLSDEFSRFELEIRNGESVYIVEISRGDEDGLYLDGKLICSERNKMRSMMFFFDGGQHEIKYFGRTP